MFHPVRLRGSKSDPSVAILNVGACASACDCASRSCCIACGFSPVFMRYSFDSLACVPSLAFSIPLVSISDGGGLAIVHGGLFLL